MPSLPDVAWSIRGRNRPRAALAAVFVLAGALVVPIAGTTASALPGPASQRQQEFADAAEEFGVPENVLLGVSYLQSRWDANAGQPSRAAGYGPMHLTDASALAAATPGHHNDGTVEDPRGDTSRPFQPPARDSGPAPESLRTLELAAALTGADRAGLRGDPRQNIRGGAAILAHYHHQQAERGGEPGDWYGAVARYSAAADTAGARRFADDVYDLIRQGTARRTDDGHRVLMPPTPEVRPDSGQLDELGLRLSRPGDVECPTDLGCEWIPAPYVNYDPTDPGAYGNHDQADRPHDLKIEYIIIHDTEGSYESTIDLVQNPRWASWQYTLRSSDGHIAQHVRHEDVAWHAGNWYVNTHSIGLEHEGFAAQGTWYTEAMYRASARLVRYLADRYDVPLDRAHILGHDNVPGTTPATVRGMHWDPGPYWDWAHYFDLLKAPFREQGGPRSGIVTIKPDYASNHPTMYGCDPAAPAAPCQRRGTTSVFLHTEPSHDAPLAADAGLHPDGTPSTRHVSDIGGRADTGQRFAVAERRGDWTAIWYLGQKVWFHSPASAPTAVNGTGLLVTPRPGLASVPVFGRAYPEEAAYRDTGVPYQAVTPLQYTMHADERYVLGGHQVPTDYYSAQTWTGPNTVVRGHQRYYQIHFGHRVAFVKVSDVRILPAFPGSPR